MNTKNDEFTILHLKCPEGHSLTSGNGIKRKTLYNKYGIRFATGDLVIDPNMCQRAKFDAEWYPVYRNGQHYANGGSYEGFLQFQIQFGSIKQIPSSSYTITLTEDQMKRYRACKVCKE